jgi:hypothetical protein
VVGRGVGGKVKTVIGGVRRKDGGGSTHTRTHLEAGLLVYPGPHHILGARSLCLHRQHRLCDICVTFVLHLCYICVTFVLHLCYICVTCVVHLYYGGCVTVLLKGGIPVVYQWCASFAHIV